jgi:hypothetical protein
MNRTPNTQVHIAVMLLWSSVVLGLLNLAMHGWLSYQATGRLETSSPLILSAAVFIYVQSRLILRLYSGHAAVRRQLAIITALRGLLLLAGLRQFYTVLPALVLLPGAAAILQVAALALVFLPPGRDYFTGPALSRR